MKPPFRSFVEALGEPGFGILVWNALAGASLDQ
jgi:hypothetical protein